MKISKIILVLCLVVLVPLSISYSSKANSEEAQAVNVVSTQPKSPAQIIEAVNTIQKNLETAEAEAEKETDKEADKEAEKEAKQLAKDGTVLKLAKIDVTGVSDELKKNIGLHMPVTIPECDADRGDVRLFFDTVKRNFRKASRALGYYDAEFTSGGSIVNNCWNLRLKIKPGRPIKVVSQNIKVIGEGKNEKIFQTILKEFPYKKGDTLNHLKYTEFKTKLSEATQTWGYFDAEFQKHTIRVDPASFQASIELVLKTGPRFRYGDIKVEQTLLSEKAINKFLIIKTGLPFKGEDLIRQQQILQRSGYFKTIKIDVLQEQAANNRVPVSILLVPKKRNAYKFKVGYGSDTGARVSAELDRRWTGSKGRQLQIKTQYAQTLSGVSLKLVNPRENPEDNSLVYNIDWTQDSNDNVIGRSINIGSQLTRKRTSGWIQTASIQALIDRTKVINENAANDVSEANLLLFGVGLEKVSADSLIFPTNGWRLKFGLNLASESALSDQNVFQVTANAKRIITVGEGRLLGRVNYGSTIVDDIETLPKSLRFFAGGGNSVRGYDFESLGESNNSGTNRGGKQLLDLSLEYQHPITDTWSAAVFADAGNAFDDFGDFTLKTGVGFGARWKSPVGPVRIDLGFPTDDLSRPKLYLSVGSDL